MEHPRRPVNGRADRTYNVHVDPATGYRRVDVRVNGSGVWCTGYLPGRDWYDFWKCRSRSWPGSRDPPAGREAVSHRLPPARATGPGRPALPGPRRSAAVRSAS
ncbi:hypothetical protein [Saccharothrix lopnurensis]|uniref:Uncharacterized protein n=1 Tax=Saccharothrix lopnurensis TaxID=1670621 RepID=A0ABW1PF77_9PSEU